MTYSFNTINATAVKKAWGWFLLWGIGLLILGLLAISSVTLTTLISIIFLGVLIFISGVIILIDAFTFWWRLWGGFFLHFFIGLFYLFAGAILIKNPIFASLSLTFILGIFYVLIGISRIIYSLTLQVFRWKLTLFNGIVTLLLGILILASWPSSSLYIIGLFVGIDLVICGWVYIMAAMYAKSVKT